SDAAPDTIFAQILRKEIPADFLHEDEYCVAFNDISPQAPIHILVIPRHPYRNISEASAADPKLVGHLLAVCSMLAQQNNLGHGFRVVSNQGPAGGQTVDHLHFHLLGGRDLSWPPG
ncbi:MAG: histidine triad nucleotide-binding protein, partial [Planctomycetota bacterium]|nr:histidine triad nucleotide-binding protein [Planctomycetota bacterium]